MDDKQKAADKVLKKRLSDIEKMLDEYAKELEQQLQYHFSSQPLIMGEFVRLREHFEAFAKIPFANLWDIMSQEAAYRDKPTFKHMLLLQKYRLKESSDKADIELLDKNVVG